MKEIFKYSYKAEVGDTVSLNVHNVGFQQCLPLYKWGPGVRNHYLIHHVISGKGYYTNGAKTYEINTGDTFIIFPFSECCYWADAFSPWEYYWVGFSGNDANMLVKLTDFTEDSPVISAVFDNNLKNAFFDIYSSRGNQGFNAVKMTGYLYLALSLIIEKSHKNQDMNSVQYYISKACEFIDFNYSNQISIQDIADYVQISRSHLYRVFMQHLKLSPVEYLAEFRIKQAALLLKNSSLSITVIANSVGFNNNLYFSKVFKKIKGMTPSQYRAKTKAIR